MIVADCRYGGAPVEIHPSSVNSGLPLFESRWLVYYEKVNVNVNVNANVNVNVNAMARVLREGALALINLLIRL